MSYADAAKKGPHQSAEEAAAPPMPEVVHTEEPDAHTLIDVDSPHISSVTSDFSFQEVQTDTQWERMEQERATAERRLQHSRDQAKAKADAAKRKAKAAEERLVRNADNPVFVGNAVVMTVFAGVLGVGAYRKIHRDGFSWSSLAAGLGLVAAFGTADYFVSRWLFQRYPPKE